MKEIKKFLKNKSYDFVEDDDKRIVTPNYIIFKKKEDYFISFEIGISHYTALNLFFEIQEYFIDNKIKINFNFYDDCYFSVENNHVDWFLFGNHAKDQYVDDIYEEIDELRKVNPKNITYH